MGNVLGGVLGGVIGPLWSGIMFTIWRAGLALLKWVLSLLTQITEPDLSFSGPLSGAMPTVLWMSLTLSTCFFILQMVLVLVRRDGRYLGELLWGMAQYVFYYLAMNAYMVALVQTCGLITRALLQSLLHVDSWSKWEPFTAITMKDAADQTVATVLGICGILLVFSAFAWGLVFFTDAGALVILAATSPIVISGLLVSWGRSWFWKMCRWFHAAALAPILMALVIGIGVQLTSGVAVGQTDSTDKVVGTAVPGVMLMLIAAFAPLALFKLLAFVDPSTGSGAAMRAGWDSAGGLQGILSGKTETGTTAAASTDDSGRSTGEAGSESTTQAKTAQASAAAGASPAGSSTGSGSPQTTAAAPSTSGGGGDAGGSGSGGGGFKTGLSKVAGAAGTLIGAGVGVAASAAAMGSDLTDQMGVGHHSYQPDFRGTRRNSSSSGGGTGPWPDAPTEPGRDDVLPPDSGNDASRQDTGSGPKPRPTPPGGGGKSASAPGGGAAGGTAGAGGAAEAAVVV